MKRKCYHHPRKDALASCLYCGRFLCHACLQKRDDGYCCKDDYDCLSFQEKENEIELVTLEEVIEETKLEKEEFEGLYLKEALKQKKDHPDPSDQPKVRMGKKTDYAKLLRSPQGRRTAILMAEILTRPKYRRR